MAIKAFDCATPLTAPLASTFVQQGYEIVARYTVPAGWKRLSLSEAEAISKAGLKIVSVYETTANRPLGGAANGTYDGKDAYKVSKALGQPENGRNAIYFAVDFDANSSQYDLIEAYLRAAKAQIGNYKIGVYGEYEVVVEMRKRGVCDFYWQTYAWSRGAVDSAANFYQFKNDITKNGIGIDENLAYSYAGEWTLIEKFEPVLDQDVANTIIDTWISKSWFDTNDNELKDRYHWYADQLRYASGILEAPVGYEFTAGVANTIIGTWISKSFGETDYVPFKIYYNWLANCLRTASGQPQQVYSP